MLTVAYLHFWHTLYGCTYLYSLILSRR